MYSNLCVPLFGLEDLLKTAMLTPDGAETAHTHAKQIKIIN